MWGAVGGAGAAIGVLLGGMLTELVDWRAIFLINLPVGIGVAVAITHVVPADVDRAAVERARSARRAGRDREPGGARLRPLAGDRGGVDVGPDPRAGLAGVIGLAAFAALERAARTPLLNVSRLGDRAVGGGFLMMLIASA